MTEKIVSAVTKVKRPDPSTQELINRVCVHYTDGTTKYFDPVEWELLVTEGKRLWNQHQKDIEILRKENFDG
tara:strand:+ start:3077 stop:3292 length:216 start_codon:yes stop_codon:yes gene_type:complete